MMQRAQGHRYSAFTILVRARALHQVPLHCEESSGMRPNDGLLRPGEKGPPEGDALQNQISIAWNSDLPGFALWPKQVGRN